MGITMGAVKQKPISLATPEAHLILQRLGQDNRSTVGVLLVNVDLPGVPRGEAVAFTLEDLHREVKVAGETRIPAGLATMHIVKQSGILDKMRDWYPGMKWIVGLRDVPGFRLLRIHTGNRDSHTQGCPLIGGGVADAWKTSDDEAMLLRSRDTYRTVHEKVFEPLFEVVEHPKLLVRDEQFLLT